MNEFKLTGKGGEIRIVLEEVMRDETSPFGGYDSRGFAEIKSGNYYVKGELWFTTGEIYQFYKQLEKCYQELNGESKFENYEHSLKIDVIFDKGHVKITGSFQERSDQNNELIFEIDSDQSYFGDTLRELKNNFYEKYGDMKGKD